MARNLSPFLILILTLFVSNPFAWGSPGFYFPDNPALPSAVSEASHAVYKISMPAGRVNRILHLNNSLEVSRAENEYRLENKKWRLQQLEFCKSFQVEICPIFEQIGDGSAFVLNESLFTNLHNFYDVISARLAKDEFITEKRLLEVNFKKPLFFILNDENEKPVIENVSTPPGLLEHFIPETSVLGRNLSFMYQPLGMIIDVIKIRLFRNTTRPLNLAHKKPIPGEAIFLIGYPMETEDRKTSGEPDSDGESLRISKGHVITFEEWQKNSGKTFDDQGVKLLKEKLIFFDADCEHGNSGGPLVNAEGEVVGIMSMGSLDQIKGNPHRVCSAVSLIPVN